MYSVHMKRVTATEARRNWFRLLDEVAAGETVVIERKGRRIVLRREEARRARGARSAEDYRGLLEVPELERADAWGWEWKEAGADLVLREEPEEPGG